uniref:Reelin domain-containing protein n=1 Tax=Daphnia galeata TaxID=27404 RepID=A0A8J2RG33_9CRUS|nr:unnamed protein product [Daphnia galeata]
MTTGRMNHHYKTAFSITALVGSIERIDGFPDGNGDLLNGDPLHYLLSFGAIHIAPASACQTMKPGHGYPEFPSQTTPSPFQAVIPVGRNFYKGYFVMAFDENDDIHIIGTFQSPSDGQLINCTSNGLDAATHKSKEDEQLVTIDWIPPTNNLGTVIFRTRL